MNVVPQDTYKKILDYFEGNNAKANLWFWHKNPNLGDVSPIDMIKLGRKKKLDDFINSSLAENFP